MTRALRGALQRRSLLLALLALTGLVVAGTVGVVGLADAAGTSPTLVVPLLVLALVAVPALGRELAVARRDEVGLARLRGADVAQVVGQLTTEPLTVLLLGTAAGVPLGLLAADAAAEAWAGGAPDQRPLLAAAVVALAVVVLGLAGVLAGTAGVVREPLAAQVSPARRARAATTATLFARALVVVAAVVAAYRTRVAGDDPDLVTLAAPALLGLAAGEAAVLALRGLARAAVPLTAQRGLAPFVAVRRLARAADSATAVRLLVAAAVVAGLALTGAGAVDDWTDETARLRAGAPLVVAYDGSAAAALRTARDADPAGEWLAAAAVVTRGDGLDRRAYVDAERFARVAGDHLASTGAAGLTAIARRLPAARRALVVEGDRLEVDAVARGAVPGALEVAVDYLADGDYAETVVARVAVASDGSVRAPAVDLPGCTRGCTPVRLTLAPGAGAAGGAGAGAAGGAGGGAAGGGAPQVTLRALRVGDGDLLAAAWSPEDPDAALTRDGRRRVVTWAGGVGSTPLLREPLALAPAAAALPLPVVTAGLGGADALRDGGGGGADGTDGADAAPASVAGPGGAPRPAVVLDDLPALPLVEGEGVLADLASAVAGSPPGVAGGEVVVLARAGTPREVLSAVRAAGGGEVRTLDGVRAAVREETGAAQARGYALVAVLAAVVAVVAVVAPARRRRGDHRREVAALRLLGVPRATLRAAGRLELAGQALVVAVVGAAGCVLAVALLLPHLPLVRVPGTAATFDPGVSGSALGLAALGAAVVCALAGAGARRVADRAAAPAVLREEAQP